MDTSNSTALDSVVRILYLDDSNARFTEKNGFLSLSADLPVDDGKTEEKTYARIFLHSAFPFDAPDEYISVLDTDQKEIGMIRSLAALSPETQKILTDELHRKYYTPEITKILNIKERYGFSYWKVEIGEGNEHSFTVQDTYRSIIRVDFRHIFILDVDGNRFEISDTEALDRASYKKIELYL